MTPQRFRSYIDSSMGTLKVKHTGDCDKKTEASIQRVAIVKSLANLEIGSPENSKDSLKVID